MVGFRVRNQEAFDPGFTCPKCLLLLRNSIQFLDCGHRQCQSCVDEQHKDKIICYQCYARIPAGQYRIDRGCLMDMMLFKVICLFCDWGGLLKDYETHLNHTHPNPICNYCNEKCHSLDDLNEHLEHKCEKRLVPCSLNSHGCNAQISPKDRSKHYRSVQHQKVLMDCIHQLKGTNYFPQSLLTLDQLQEPIKTMNELNITSDRLNETIQRLHNEYTRDEHLVQLILQQLSSLKQSMDNQNTSINQIDEHETSSQEELRIAKQQLEESQMKLTNGIFIWRIDNILQKIMAAQSDVDAFIDSPPFYSTPTGYKMGIRLFLNGNPTARGRFISLQFLLMRGEYDAILRFPFCFFVSLSLLDQTNERNHIFKQFQPEISSRNCQRPQVDMNIINEISEFVSLDTLRKENNPYIRDNTIFIKTIIDFGTGLKDIESYAVNVNPALPISTQQAMIEQEKSKHRPV